jgi:hypothetical protein
MTETDPKSPALKDAEERKAIADADLAAANARKAAAEADRARVSALIPNLTDANKSTMTEDAADPVLMGSLVAHHALKSAIQKVYEKLRTTADDRNVLVSGDEAQATADAVYLQVKDAIEGLRGLADVALAPSDETASIDLAAPVVGAIASAIPSVLAAFSSKRTLKSEALTADTKTAVAAIAGRLAELNKTRVWLDNVRPVPHGSITTGVKELQQRRVRLQALVTAPSPPGDGADRIALAKQVVAAIDAFLTAVLTTPTGASRSPYAEAALRDQMHVAEGDNHIDQLLVVSCASADSQQATEDRAFMLNDRYNVVASVTVRFALIDARSGELLVGGTESGTARLTGEIGSTITVQLVGND